MEILRKALIVDRTIEALAFAVFIMVADWAFPLEGNWFDALYLGVLALSFALLIWSEIAARRTKAALDELKKVIGISS